MRIPALTHERIIVLATLGALAYLWHTQPKPNPVEVKGWKIVPTSPSDPNIYIPKRDQIGGLSYGAVGFDASDSVEQYINN